MQQSGDYRNGRSWATWVYDKERVWKGDPLRAAHVVQGIAARKLFAGGRLGGKELPLAPSRRDFWRGVLDQANEHALSVQGRLGEIDPADIEKHIARARRALAYEEPEEVAKRLEADGASREQAYLIVVAAKQADR